MSASRFSGTIISTANARFRPVYPKELRNIIIKYMRCAGKVRYDVALDVACGSGQSTFLLCESFKKVIGVDVSKTQIEQANIKKVMVVSQMLSLLLETLMIFQ